MCANPSEPRINELHAVKKPPPAFHRWMKALPNETARRSIMLPPGHVVTASCRGAY